MGYIRSAGDAPSDDDRGCVFCLVPEREPDRVLARGETSYVVLNRYPYNPGHILVIPYRHVGDLEDLSREEDDELHELIRRSVRALREDSQPHGFNIGMNLGAGAGAGIPGHMHWHVVPRWHADTNFMSVVGQTRVLPELLADTSRRLAPRFAS